jgi:hypothetical protein
MWRPAAKGPLFASGTMRLRLAAMPSDAVLRQAVVVTRACGGAARLFSSNSDEPATGGQWKTFGGLDTYTAPKYKIQTFNKISSLGLARFPSDHYDVLKDSSSAPASGESKPVSAHAILLRSYKIKEEEVSPSVQAIARCGAGTNNIPVSRMTELGTCVNQTRGRTSASPLRLLAGSENCSF